jgi:cytochrome c oxidase subunit III
MEAASIAHGEHEHHGPPPANRSSRVEPQLLGMLLFIISEAILLSSSITMHWAQTSIKNGNRLGLKAGILSTFFLGATFLFIQVNEYVHIGFAPHDFAQGSIFYGLTGLHGAHVFVGLTLLAMVVVRSFRGHYTPEEHRGVEVPGIYWHFVDVMWVIVYSSVYIL